MSAELLIFTFIIFTSPSQVEHVKNLLSSPQPEKRIEAINKIVKKCTLNPVCSEKELLPAIALEDPVVDVRVNAINAIRKLGMKEQLNKICSIVTEFAQSEVLKNACRIPPPVKKKPVEGKKAFSYPLPDPTRIGYTPSAFLRKSGTFAWNTYMLGYWVFDYTFNDNFSFIMHTSIPALQFGFGPGLKASLKIADNLRIGFLGHFIYGLLYAWSSSIHLLSIGGLPFILSYGTPDGFISLSLLTYGFFVFEEETHTAWVVDPNIGGFLRLSDAVGIQAEIHVPTFNYKKDHWTYEGILYGLRISGRRVYGDINFIVPIFEDTGDLLQYLPLGVPFISVGIVW